MNIPALLDAAKKAQGFETDMALAKALGVSRSAVSAWRNGVKTPDTVQAAALAGYTGIPLAKVLGIVGEARAISAKEKAIWRRLATSAALLAIGVLGVPQAPAVADSGRNFAVNGDTAHYVKLRGWLWSLLKLLWSHHTGRCNAGDKNSTLEASICL